MSAGLEGSAQYSTAIILHIFNYSRSNTKPFDLSNKGFIFCHLYIINTVVDHFIDVHAGLMFYCVALVF
jgi:hypothetical protein